LIEAFVRIAPRRPDARLLLFGNGEEAQALRQMVPAELADRVHFLGSRPQQEVAERLGRARISVLPTLTSEGHPKAVIESMACGTPVVCSRVPGLEGLIEDGATGSLVPPGDVPALAGALLRLLEDDALWTSMSTRSLVRSRLFGKDRILRRQVQVMRIMAGAHATGE
jgi:glycosyltransferase involved in cell wall biosynthesis